MKKPQGKDQAKYDALVEAAIRFANEPEPTNEAQAAKHFADQIRETKRLCGIIQEPIKTAFPRKTAPQLADYKRARISMRVLIAVAWLTERLHSEYGGKPFQPGDLLTKWISGRVRALRPLYRYVIDGGQLKSIVIPPWTDAFACTSHAMALVLTDQSVRSRVTACPFIAGKPNLTLDDILHSIGERRDVTPLLSEVGMHFFLKKGKQRFCGTAHRKAGVMRRLRAGERTQKRRLPQ